MSSTLRRFLALVPLVALAAASPSPAAADAPALTLEPGDRIAIIGNTLAERKQHYGYFETLLHSRFPAHELYVRNLGWSADELFLRPRGSGFGSADEHLERHRADVVLAFFGFNESFAGPEGVAAFRDDLARFIQATAAQRYNPDSLDPPRLVLISPIAAEDTADDRHASAAALNDQIAPYVKAMRDVAESEGVAFVDLFTPTRRLMAESAEAWTINGIHLNDAGYRAFARLLDTALFGETGQAEAFDERLRQELLDRNDCFFHSYRAVNGVTIYGIWSPLTHEPDRSFTNADVLERERAIFEQMAANRDERIWAIAQGPDVPAEADDANLPSQYEVQTNLAGDHRYLYGEEALETFTLPEGYAIEAFASEQQFPELVNPVALRFDGQGRLWVSTMPLFPSRRPDQELQGSILVFEDTTGDGKADDMTVFADGLHVINGFELGDGGVYVSAQPHLKYLADTTGDGRADVRERIMHGFGADDSHHAISSFTWTPDGAMLLLEGVFARTQVETPRGPTRMLDSGVYRWTPHRHDLDVFISYRFLNPWGSVFDRWGMNLITNGDSPEGYYAGLLSGRVAYPQKQADRAPHFSLGVRPVAGAQLISSGHFPQSSQGDLLTAICAGPFRGIRQARVRDDGAGVDIELAQELLASSDPSFRPIEMEFGPDGALYVTDFYTRHIGHATHSQRDPLRDQSHGRIYRITYTDRPLLEPQRVAGRPVDALLDLLKSPKDRTIYNARRELREHDDDAVLAAAAAWERTLDHDHPEYERHLLEVMWLHMSRDVLRADLLERLLRADDFRARAAATRALRHWLDAVDDRYALLEQQIKDEHPRVRLEAVIALSFLQGDRARRLAAMVEEHEMDEHLAYALAATRRALQQD